MNSLEGVAGTRTPDVIDPAIINAPEYQKKLADYRFMLSLLNAYHQDGLETKIADFLDNDAKFALQSLVTVFSDKAVKPETIHRGFTKKLPNSFRSVRAAGWLVTRNAYEIYNSDRDQFETVTNQLIVTPQNLVLSKDLPYLANSDNIEIPSFDQFGGAEYLYKYEFVTSAIVESVFAQLVSHGIDPDQIEV